ncbi:MAG: hypothetical protein HC765_03995 [Brachymonas sp.]|nr:hypothetical protein [Brachymonas sp.]
MKVESPMNRTPQYRITAGGQSVQLRGNARNARPANRARASRFLPHSLSWRLRKHLIQPAAAFLTRSRA